MLESVLKSAMQSSTMDLAAVIVHAHINLSLVLQQMDAEPEKQKEYVCLHLQAGTPSPHLAY